MTTIFVSDLQFLAFHGISEAERQVGHRLKLDLSAEVEETACESDLLAESVDYAALASDAVQICTATRCQTLEFACERIARTLLDRNPGIRRLTVTLAKLNPSIPENVHSVGVSRTLSK